WISLSFGELRTLRVLSKPSSETWSTWKLRSADDKTTVTRSCTILPDFTNSPMADDSKVNRYSIHSLGRDVSHDQIQALLPNEEQDCEGKPTPTEENPSSPSGQDAGTAEDVKTTPATSQTIGNATVSVNIPTEQIKFQPPIPPVPNVANPEGKTKFVFFKRIPAGPARVKPPIQMNAFAQKKTLAQGLMDIALLTANASQMKLVLTEGPDRVLFYHFLMTMLSLSVICQCFVGFLLLYKARLNIEDEHEQHAADTANNWATALVMVITIINVFISSFGIKLDEPQQDTTATEPGAAAPHSGSDNT
ncbi:NINJ1, partial [Branchiostoma lanceolatum]